MTANKILAGVITFLFIVSLPTALYGMTVDNTASFNNSNQKQNISDSLNVNEIKENKKIWNELCPVLGFAIDSTQETILFDKKVYGFCCKDCPRKFSKNPVGYSANLSTDGKKFIGKKGIPIN